MAAGLQHLQQLLVHRHDWLFSVYFRSAGGVAI